MGKGLERSLDRGRGRNIGHRFDAEFSFTQPAITLVDTSGVPQYSTFQQNLNRDFLSNDAIIITDGAIRVVLTKIFADNLADGFGFEFGLGTRNVVDSEFRIAGEGVNLVSRQAGQTFTSGVYEATFPFDGDPFAVSALTQQSFFAGFSWNPLVTPFTSQDFTL